MADETISGAIFSTWGRIGGPALAVIVAAGITGAIVAGARLLKGT